MKKFTSFILAIMLGLSVSTIRAEEPTLKQDVILDLEGKEKSEVVNVNYGQTTNLLVSNDGGFLEEVESDGRVYELESVKITRDRIKMTVEYYEGDYNNSTLIGTDTGYADYDDYVSSYILKNIAAVNDKFGTNVPTTHSMIRTDGGSYLVPSYQDSNGEIVVKILLAKVKRYSIFGDTYQNKQNVSFPDYLGKTKTEIDSDSSDFWIVDGHSQQYNAVVGQKIKLKSSGQFKDSQIISGRQSEFRGLATPNSVTGILEEAPEEWEITETSTNYELKWFYEVDDLGSELKKPSYSNSFSSGARINIIGESMDWKSPQVSETLVLENAVHKNKLMAYPFNIDGDPFDTPEYELDRVPANWILFHNLKFEYTYKDVTPLINNYDVVFNSQGGTFIPTIEKVNEGNLIMKPADPTRKDYKFLGWTLDPSGNKLWNFENDGVYTNITLYALWEENVMVPGGNNTDKPSITPDPSESLPQTGVESSTLMPVMVLLMGAALVVIEGMRKNSNH